MTATSQTPAGTALPSAGPAPDHDATLCRGCAETLHEQITADARSLRGQAAAHPDAARVLAARADMAETYARLLRELLDGAS